MVLRGQASLGESVVALGEKTRGPLASVPTQPRDACRRPGPAIVPVGKVRELGTVATARCTGVRCGSGGRNQISPRPDEAYTAYFQGPCVARCGLERGLANTKSGRRTPLPGLLHQRRRRR